MVEHSAEYAAWGLLVALGAALALLRTRVRRRRAGHAIDGAPARASLSPRARDALLGLAIPLLLLEVGLLLLLPWAALVREIGRPALLAALPVLAALGVGLAYAWRGGADAWD